MKQISLFGSGIDSYSKSVTAQRRLNCFYDVRQDGEKSQIIVKGTPGSTSWIAIPNSPIRGWWVVGNTLYIVGGRILYKVTTAGVYTAIGTLSTSTGFVSMADNNVQLLLTDGTHGYVYTIITGSYAQASLNNAGSFGIIADANYPQNATSVTFINGRMLANLFNSRQCYASQSYDATNWGATSPATVIYFTKENSSDLLQYVEVFNSNIILWGVESIEFWQDVGGSSLPYQRISGATQSYGLAAPLSTAVAGGQKYFLADVPSGGYQVCVLNGYQAIPVSTSDVDNIINSFSTVADAVALNYIVDGHDMYQITFPTGGRSLLYDTNTKIWSEVQTGVSLIATHFAQRAIVFNDFVYMADSSTGTIYQQSETAQTDNGVPIKRQAISKHIRDDGNMFGISELYLDMETGNGIQVGQGSNPQIMLEVSKDGGRTYLPQRILNVGATGNYLTRVIARRFGMSRDFVFRITMTDPVQFIITDTAVTTFAAEGV